MLMLSMPPATMISALPATIRSCASMAAFIAEPHILDRVVQFVDSGRPPLIDACRAGAGGVLRGRAGRAVDDQPQVIPVKPQRIPAFTDREIEVLEWVADGRCNQWIAERLTLSPLTVKAHLLGMRVAEVPTTWRDRTAGQSRFQLWRWLPRYMRWYRRGISGRFRRGR